MISGQRHKVKSAKEMRQALAIVWPQIDGNFLPQVGGMREKQGGSNQVLNSFILSLLRLIGVTYWCSY
jgi:hypothetical protein